MSFSVILRVREHRNSKTPDVAGTTWLGELRFVGELKVPWVFAHSLELALLNERHFRDLLGKA